MTEQEKRAIVVRNYRFLMKQLDGEQDFIRLAYFKHRILDLKKNHRELLVGVK